VSGAQSVDAQLILLAAERLHAAAHLGSEMEWISHQSEWNTQLVQQLQYVPETGVQDWVTARYVEVGQAVHPLAHLAAGVDGGEATLPRHLHELWMSLTEYVTMFATLVANVRYVPLKSKVFHSSKKIFLRSAGIISYHLCRKQNRKLLPASPLCHQNRKQSHKLLLASLPCHLNHMLNHKLQEPLPLHTKLTGRYGRIQIH
jgi:hypothetical protein